MTKKSVKNQGFLIFFVLVLFFLSVSCAKIRENCDSLTYKSESPLKYAKMLQKNQIFAQFRCEF